MIIKSKALEPFHIDVQEDQYVLVEDKIIQDGPNAGNIHEMTFGYYKSLNSLIKRVVQIKLSREEEVVNLNQFIEKWREMKTIIDEEISL